MQQNRHNLDLLLSPATLVRLLIPLVLLCSTSAAQKGGLQPPVGKVIGGAGLDEINDLVITASGQLVGIGNSSFEGNQVRQGWWLSWDTDNNLVENQPGDAATYTGYDALLNIAAGGYIAVGTKFISDEQQYDGLVVNIDRTGKILWSNHFGGERWDWFKDVVPDGRGGYYLTGWTDSFGSGDSDMLLINIDDRGRELYRRTFGGFDNEWTNTSLVLPGGVLVIAGATATYSIGGDDIWVLGLDRAGEVLWERTLGGHLDEEAQSIVAVSDSEFVVLANVSANERVKQHIILIGFSNSGQVLWTNTLKSAGGLMGTDILRQSEKQLVVVGTILSASDENSDVLLLGTDHFGEEIWRKTYGGPATDMGTAGAVDADGVIYVAAKTYSYGLGDGDLWLFMVDTEGNSLDRITNQGDQ